MHLSHLSNSSMVASWTAASIAKNSQNDYQLQRKNWLVSRIQNCFSKEEEERHKKNVELVRLHSERCYQNSEKNNA